VSNLTGQVLIEGGREAKIKLFIRLPGFLSQGFIINLKRMMD
jgi:hypothetical protein